jgi:hypothetical protein
MSETTSNTAADETTAAEITIPVYFPGVAALDDCGTSGRTEGQTVRMTAAQLEAMERWMSQ